MSNAETDATPTARAAAQRDELARQYRILMKEAPVRLVMTSLAYALASLFLPLSIVLISFAVNLVGEIMSARALRNLDPVREPSRYIQCLAWVFILELGFSVVPAMVWHLEGEYMKAFAVGLAVSTIMHVSTVRAIHLPMGITGLAAVGLAAFVSNTLFWLKMGDYGSLAFTTVCVIAALGYALGAMTSNNRLHQETVRGRVEAQAANAAKGAFLAQMSHELRTPLNAILGMGHAELRRTDDPVSHERLSVLISSAEGLSTILDDILDMSAIQGGHLPIRRHAAAVGAEVAATTALFRPQIEEAGLALTLDLSDDLPSWALLDAQRLRQCLSNLLSNALKNTTAGEITVRVRRIDRGSGDTILRIEVADTGPGISPDKADAMFEPFVRGPGISLGTGLGLSITRALALQMGGNLQLDQSKYGIESGAHFVLTLPLEATSAPDAPQDNASASPINLTGRRVLVVDDIASNRLVAATYLRYFGANPIEAPDGATALQHLTDGGIDLVLLDMNMPEMDGLETFARLRKLPGPAGQVPVIAMTANTLSDHRKLYSDVGFSGYLAKPVTPDVAAAEIRRVLENVVPTTETAPIATAY
jgi:two-component system, sensor histidine kinase